MENDQQELEKIRGIAKEAESLYQETKKNVDYLKGYADGYRAGLEDRA